MGVGRLPAVLSGALQPPCLLRVPVGSPGLCRDQQAASQGLSAQGQWKGSQVLLTPVCSHVREEEEGPWARAAARLLSGPCPAACPGGRKGGWSVFEEGTFSLLSQLAWASWGNWCVASLASCSLQWHGDSLLFPLEIFQMLFLLIGGLMSFRV